MFWVLSVLAYRTVRGDRGEETVHREYIVYEQVPETLFAAPPHYVDEKVKVEAHEGWRAQVGFNLRLILICSTSRGNEKTFLSSASYFFL
jgi:hypothetical protein